MKRRLLLPILLLAAVACGPKWEAHDGDGYFYITQKDGPTLGYTSSAILEDNGYAFKDLNRNGVIDPYEDWRLPADVRAKDLAARLSAREPLYTQAAHVLVDTDGLGPEEIADEIIISCL